MKNIRVGVEVAKITRIRVERGYLRPSEDPGLRGAEVIIVRKSFRGFKKRAGKYRVEVYKNIVERFIGER